MALNNVPLTGQNLLQTRDPIAANWTTIDDAFKVDHVEFNTTGEGKHNTVTFPLQTADPIPLANEEILYNKTTVQYPGSNLWLKSFSGNNFPMTGYVFNNTAPLSGGNGWLFTPANFKVTWGTASIVAGGAVTIIFANPANGGITGFPGFVGDGSGNFVGFFNLTRVNATAVTNFPILSALSLTQMTIRSSDGNNLTFMWNVTGY